MPHPLRLTLALTVAFGATAAALHRRPPTPAAAPAPPAPSAYLSVGVQVEAEHWFQRVSFKDVGLSTPDRATRDDLVEAIAEGVAMSLSPALSAHSMHADELANPAWHRTCQASHVYVDVWQSVEPDRIGFSLWRGCGDEDQFGWQEMSVDRATLRGAGWAAAAMRVGQAIGAALTTCGAATC